MSNVKFDKFAQEANEFINELATELGHPDNQEQTLIVLRSVLHSIRDRITIGESFDLLSQLPIMLKGIYVEGWKYHEKPNTIRSLEEFKNDIKARQEKYGERQFDWDLSTEEIVSKTINKLRRYLTEGQIKHIEGQLPAEVKPLLHEA